MSASDTRPHHVDRISHLVADEDPPAGLCTVYAAIRELREGKTKDGRPYFDVTFADTSGNVAGKVWDDAGRAIEAARGLSRGDTVKVLFEPSSYRGVMQLKVRGMRAVGDEDVAAGFSPADVHGEGFEQVADLVCQTLVFDIETVPATDLRKVPPTIAQAVTKHADRTDADEGKVMSLSPWFGQVVSLALGEGERAELSDEDVTVLAVPPPGREDDEFPPWMRMMSEADLLRAFWLLAGRADVVVTYNGRGFDVPFLVARSLIHGIPVTVDLMGYGMRPHLDLFKVLASGGARSGGRGLGPSSLDVVCWSLGITSPKGEMDGSMVAPTYARGDIEMIAEYNRGDVRATAAVYQHVADHLLRFRDDW